MIDRLMLQYCVEEGTFTIDVTYKYRGRGQSGNWEEGMCVCEEYELEKHVRIETIHAAYYTLTHHLSALCKVDCFVHVTIICVCQG